MAIAAAPAPPDHLDLVLQQIDELPTLSSIAVRVMSLSEAENADLREISRIVESDPALSARMLALCRRADRAVANRITTVERAIVMLGMEAVRSALLAVEVHKALEAAPGEQALPPGAGLNRPELWRHCLAVACASELIAERHRGVMGMWRPQEAFLAGLLHDLGKLALDRVLPRAYARVVEVVDARPVDIAEVERKVLGIDHHIAGKRLAEHWRLPHALIDVMWLHNQPARMLPPTPHRPLIGLVTVADALARRMHLGWSGAHGPAPDVEARFSEFGFEPRSIPAIERALQKQVAQRTADIGIGEPDEPEVLLGCIRRANARLGQLSGLLAHRAAVAGAHTRALAAITEFHALIDSRRTLPDAQSGVIRSAVDTLGRGFYAVLIQTRSGAPWSVLRVDAQGRASTHWVLESPPGHRDLSELCDPMSRGLDEGPVLSWLAAQLDQTADSPRIRLLPLIGGSGLSALMLHDRADVQTTVGEQGLTALARAWGAALAAASQHEGARRLGEQLSAANRELAAAQNDLIEARSMARLGELAKGAAHEMNNPLTVISGQGQLLARSSREQNVRSSAQAIVEASEKLTELITSLHLFAEPPTLRFEALDLLALLQQAAKDARDRAAGLIGGSPVGNSHAGKDALANLRPVRVSAEEPIPSVRADRSLLTLALTELILNSLQASPKENVQVRAHIDPFDDRLLITVTDDGTGMSEHALRHAFDPFFSELPAGRRSGLGLTRARRFIELHGGDLTLESEPAKGCCARVSLPEWRAAASHQPHAERQEPEAA